MEAVAHWTQNTTADFIYSISSNFVAQIETKIEEEGVSQNEIASKMNKTSGRISQVLNNPGNLSIRVMVELARALGMKVSIVAYDDHDPNNDLGPIAPDVFVKCWERAGYPASLLDVEKLSSCSSLYAFNKMIMPTITTAHISRSFVDVYFNTSDKKCRQHGVYSDPARIFDNSELRWFQDAPVDSFLGRIIWHEQNLTTKASQEKKA